MANPSGLLSALAVVLSLGAPALAAGVRPAAPPALTASGHVMAEVDQAIRKGGVLTVTVRFVTESPDYPGEVVYDGIPAAEVVRRVYLRAGDRDFPAHRVDGAFLFPEALHLAPNEGGDAGASVGIWEGVFEAPDHDLREITLHLPNVDPIGPFPIRNR